jgi:class 3 adenylate cyclase
MNLIKVLSFILLFNLYHCKQNQEIIIPKAIKGVLDLRSWDFNYQNFRGTGIINLDGEWEFYWNEFLDPTNIVGAEYIQPLQDKINYISVPNSWNGHNVSPNNDIPHIIDGDGHATYRLKFITNQTSGLSIQLPTMGTAYKLFINGKLITMVGQIGITPEESKPDYKVQIVRIPEVASGEYELIFHISNFNYKQGGIWYPIPIGLDRDIVKEREKNLFVDIFLAGSLLIMGLYHLGLFSVKRKDSSALWFGIICILVSLRTLLTGEFYFYTLFPNFPFDLGVKLEYIAFYLGIPFFILYLREIFPEDSPKIPIRVMQISSYLLLIPVIIFPPRIFTHTVLVMEVIAILAILLGLFIFIRAIFSNREGAKSFLAGSIFLILAIVNDILHTNLIIYTGFYTPTGLFIFIFSQAFLLSARFAKAFTQVEDLSENLEHKVIERTEQLNQANKTIEIALQKSDKLLLNILPEEVAHELKEKGLVTPVLFESTSILFTDFKGFTQIAERLTPQKLIQELDSCFKQFDKIIEKYNLEKLKTIGDSYMCAGGIPKVNATHAIDSCLAALEIQSFMNEMKEQKKSLNSPYWELRLGIHSGPVMAGVVGEKKFAYDIWGDTVNTASRMESSGTAGRINISYATYELVKDYFDCEYRGEVDAKNKGKVKMYYLNRINKEYAKDEAGLVPTEILLSKIKSRS